MSTVNTTPGTVVPSRGRTARAVGQEPLHLADGVSQPRGKAGDALAVDHPVVDQPHGPRDPGDAPGMQRLHARNPASWAAAAVG